MHFTPTIRQLGPSVATWSHQICGILAALAAVKGIIEAAAGLVVLAWIFDLADGFWARAVLKNDPPEEQQALATFGDKLDAIVDGYNFGWLPCWVAGWAGSHAGLNQLQLAVLVLCGAFYAMSVQYRLARSHFLEKVPGTVWFWGSPCPAPAMLLVSVTAAMYRNGSPESWWLLVALHAVLYIICGRVCWSTVKYSHNKVWWTKIPGEFLVLSCLALIGVAVGWTLTAQPVDGLLTGLTFFWGGYMLQPPVYRLLGTHERIK